MKLYKITIAISAVEHIDNSVEFVEADEDENGWYYRHALQLSKDILESSN